MSVDVRTQPVARVGLDDGQKYGPEKHREVLRAFDTPVGKAMIFEMLDMSLVDYFNEFNPLPLSDIHSITQQVATALQVLKDLSIIHCDLKMDNVMVVDHTQKPLRLKLIDFGMARRTLRQPPEIILGLPFNEAMDVWCLGTMIFSLMSGFDLFPNKTEFEALKVMVKLLGQLPDHLLDEAKKTRRFFNPVNQSWTLLSRALYKHDTEPYVTECGNSLHEIVEMFEEEFKEEVKKLGMFSDLLQQMLQVEVADRITPSEILQHPFISSDSEDMLITPAESTTEQSSPASFDISSYFKPLTRCQLRNILPEGCNVIKMLGDGKFGQMVKCKRPDTWKIVTLKLPFPNNRTRREVQLLRKIRNEGMNHQNIVTFIDTIETRRGEALTANALKALKPIGLIHTGVMVENIWICSGQDKPLQIKLADFGAVLRKKKVVAGMTAQLVHYRAPEVIIGLPFGPAIDVWSLGCMLVKMLIGFDMFPSQTEYDTLRTIIHFFGEPSDIDVADKREECFYMKSSIWKLKSAKRYEKFARLPPGSIQMYDTEKYDSVETLIKSNLSISKPYRPQELAKCISLVTDMLVVDSPERIFPAEILEHPFIWYSPLSQYLCNKLQLHNTIFSTMKTTLHPIKGHNLLTYKAIMVVFCFVYSERSTMEEPEAEEQNVIQQTHLTVFSPGDTGLPLDEEDNLQCNRSTVQKRLKKKPKKKTTNSVTGKTWFGLVKIEKKYFQKSIRLRWSGGDTIPKKKNRFQRFFSWLRRLRDAWLRYSLPIVWSAQKKKIQSKNVEEQDDRRGVTIAWSAGKEKQSKCRFNSNVRTSRTNNRTVLTDKPVWEKASKGRGRSDHPRLLEKHQQTQTAFWPLFRVDVMWQSKTIIAVVIEGGTALGARGNLKPEALTQTHTTHREENMSGGNPNPPILSFDSTPGWPPCSPAANDGQLKAHSRGANQICRAVIGLELAGGGLCCLCSRLRLADGQKGRLSA
ncbi:hypothetical protein WMY93_025586 [Mugilogobius chulae]|uniref:Protein kinase domain-containing protein n=1 Tax=Mugilogobius chulae TaxID=88201 RepID=A0AAW0N6X6_9GOBI